MDGALYVRGDLCRCGVHQFTLGEEGRRDLEKERDVTHWWEISKKDSGGRRRGGNLSKCLIVGGNYLASTQNHHEQTYNRMLSQSVQTYKPIQNHEKPSAKMQRLRTEAPFAKNTGVGVPRCYEARFQGWPSSPPMEQGRFSFKRDTSTPEGFWILQGSCSVNGRSRVKLMDIRVTCRYVSNICSIQTMLKTR